MKIFLIKLKWVFLSISIIILIYFFILDSYYFIIFRDYVPCLCFNEYNLDCENTSNIKYNKSEILINKSENQIFLYSEYSRIKYIYYKTDGNLWSRIEREYINHLNDTLITTNYYTTEGNRIQYKYYTSSNKEIVSLTLTNIDIEYSFAIRSVKIPTVIDIMNINDNFKNSKIADKDIFIKYFKKNIDGYVLFYEFKENLSDLEMDKRFKINDKFIGKLAIVHKLNNCFEPEAEYVDLKYFLKKYPNLEYQ